MSQTNCAALSVCCADGLALVCHTSRANAQLEREYHTTAWPVRSIEYQIYEPRRSCLSLYRRMGEDFAEGGQKAEHSFLENDPS